MAQSIFHLIGCGWNLKGHITIPAVLLKHIW